MIGPTCPDHHDLALDLAQGRLDDAAAAEAESIRRTCPVCRGWWGEHLEGQATAAVDQAVTAALDRLDLPRRHSHRGWLAAAAALVMALGAGGLWLAQRPQSATPTAVDRVAVIEAFDFESAATRPAIVVAEADEVAPEGAGVSEAQPERIPVREASSANEVKVAAAVAADEPADHAPQSIFTGDFESGDLGGWVPAT